MSKQSLLHQLSGTNNRIRCPVTGCSAYWTKASATLDEQFEFRLKRFKSRHLSQRNLTSSSASAVRDDNDE